MKRLLVALLALSAFLVTSARADDRRQLVFVTIDGLRWQEVFRGADPTLVKNKLWRERFIDVPDRRTALMPFLASIGERGVLLGNRDSGSCAQVSNRYWFSYPGYAEMLTGRANPSVGSNAKTFNQDVTALEWIHRRPGFAGEVKVFHEWSVAPYIVNAPRSNLPVYAPEEDSSDHDGQVMAAVKAAFDNSPPRVSWIGLGDTDNRAHEGDYYRYLAAAVRADQFIAQLWSKLERDASFAGKTTLIITTDHGRGESQDSAWRGHGSGLYRGLVVPGLRRKGSDAVWMAAMGPNVASDTVAGLDGETCATTSQIAATLIEALGLEPKEFSEEAAAPLSIFRQSRPTVIETAAPVIKTAETPIISAASPNPDPPIIVSDGPTAPPSLP